MDLIKTALVDADPESTQTSEKWKSTPQSKVKATILTETGETRLRLPVNADATPAFQQLRLENPNQTARPTRHTNENHDYHRFHRLTSRSPSVHETASTSANGNRIASPEREQKLAVASTPKEELAERIRRITALQLGGKEYQVYAYVAAPDMSCKRVATGIDSETHPDELMANPRSPQALILFARMLGKSTAALITFDGLEVPRTIYYYGGELLCRHYRPLSQACSIYACKPGTGRTSVPSRRVPGSRTADTKTHRRPTNANRSVCCVEAITQLRTQVVQPGSASPSTNHTSYVTPATPVTPTTFPPPPTLGL
ncbi:hypothetical protein HPB49_002309 [Dermacentor silvarum]|uniref:Uncharacterized protein n=1 Tax=Dermacentor silvarum TaxID=543639 RepID=A0ACB8CD27_DERSI|nr:hypothetical protein HPB49_002309 [Dermacentor silvarum]